MEVPMEVDSEDTINRKRNKRLILVMIGLLAAAAIAIGSMAFLTWFQDDEKVVYDAVTTALSDKGIFNFNGVNLNGSYDLKTKTGADSYKIDFDLASTNDRSQGTLDIKLKNSTNLNIVAMYKSDGSLFFMGKNMKDFVRESGGARVETCADNGECNSLNQEIEEEAKEAESNDENKDANTDEDSEEELSSDQTGLLSLIRYGRDIANIMDEKWYKANIDSLFTSSDIGDDSCIANSLKTIRSDVNDNLLKKAYIQNPFLNIVRIEKSPSNGSKVYVLKIDKERMVSFLNIVNHRDGFVKLNKCRGEAEPVKLTVDDLDFKSDLRVELTISNWKHVLKSIKVTGTLVDKSVMSFNSDINLGVQMPTTEPEECADEETLRGDLEAGLKGGMKQMYAVLANTECPKRDAQVIQSCKEQVINQGNQTIEKFKFNYPIDLSDLKL